MNRDDIYTAIDKERLRQSKKWDRLHPHGFGDCSSPDVATAVKVAVLAEEVGEVARAFLDGDEPGLCAELVQVCAVAIAILESDVLVPTIYGPHDVPLFETENAL